MRRPLLEATLFLCAAAFALNAAPAGQASPDRGRIEFTARVTPASGRTEPARGLTIFLLTKSFQDIDREALGKTPPPDFNGFVDHTAFSKEMKEWMKREHTVAVSGPQLRNHMNDDDVLHVPEFFDAYVNSNLSGLNQGFPEPKYTAPDRDANTKKYQKYHVEYDAAVLKYLKAHPESKDGMDTILEQRDPSNAWGVEVMRWNERAHALAVEIAQTDYLAAKTETNLEGRGAFQTSPGTFWLSSLDGEALGGDRRLRWNVRVEVRAGDVTRVELSNLNAEKHQ